jgi:hypothetical protein
MVATARNVSLIVRNYMKLSEIFESIQVYTFLGVNVSLSLNYYNISMANSHQKKILRPTYVVPLSKKHRPPGKKELKIHKLYSD